MCCVHKSPVRLFPPPGPEVLTPVAFSLVANRQFLQQFSATPGCESLCPARGTASWAGHDHADLTAMTDPQWHCTGSDVPSTPPPPPHLGTPHGRSWVNYRLLVSEQWESRGLSKFHHAQDLKEIQRTVWVSLRGPQVLFLGGWTSFLRVLFLVAGYSTWDIALFKLDGPRKRKLKIVLMITGVYLHWGMENDLKNWVSGL